MSEAARTPSLVDVHAAFDQPFNDACCRWAMRRAIGYLLDGTPQGRDLALDLLRGTLRTVEGRQS